MPVNLRPQHLALAVVSACLGMLLTASALLLSQRRTPVAFDCHDERDGERIVPELILQSGSEYLLAFPSIRELTNSHLVSVEAPAGPLLPAR